MPALQPAQAWWALYSIVRSHLFALSQHTHAHAELRILLDFAAGISNWGEVAASRGLRGWQDCTPGSSPGCIYVCAWSGVSCDIDSNRISAL